MIRKSYTLEHLACAHCAGKMEKRIQGLEGIESAEIAFAVKKLSLTAKSEKLISDSIPVIESIVQSIEPNTRIVEAESTEHPPKAIAALAGKNPHLILSAILFTASFFAPWKPLSFALLLLSYFLSGRRVVAAGLRNVSNGFAMDENFLMTTATLSAWAIGEPHEAVAVMLFFGIGEVLEEMAVEDSRSSIRSLLKLKSETANVCAGDNVISTPPEQVEAGSIILVKPGERISLDGTLVEGESFVDTSAVTGEPVPKNVKKGDRVFGGFINKTGAIKLMVEKPYQESMISRILQLVEDAASKKASSEKLITRFARIYTPAVVIAALSFAVFLPLSGSFTFSESIYTAAVFLVVSCPCALVVSVPLAFYAGIGAASKHGILIKGGHHLETLARVKGMLFDKTGTLTMGNFEIAEIKSVSGFSKNDILRYAAHVESRSNHPIAISILNSFDEPVVQSSIEDFQEVAGRGVQAVIDGRLILVGNPLLLESFNIIHELVSSEDTVIHVAIDNIYAGYIKISDTLKKDTLEGISRIRYEGISHMAIVSGDRREIVERLAERLKFESFHSDLLPDEKMQIVEEYSKKRVTGFAGDGINDTPSLAAADVGISMGALGSDAAIESSDVVIMNDDIASIATAIRIGKRVRAAVMENIVFSLSAKTIIMALAALGHASMWAAVFADVGVTLLAVLNSMRIIMKKY